MSPDHETECYQMVLFVGRTAWANQSWKNKMVRQSHTIVYFVHTIAFEYSSAKNSSFQFCTQNVQSIGNFICKYSRTRYLTWRRTHSIFCYSCLTRRNSSVYQKSMVLKPIHTHYKEEYWKFQGAGGGTQKLIIFRGKSEQKLKFLGG